MLQTQSQRVTTFSAPAQSRVAAAQSHPRRSPAFSGISSHSFATGRAICARPVCRVTSRCRNRSVHADVFFTQKTVPDQTGRVAIVTGKLSALLRSTLMASRHPHLTYGLLYQEAPRAWALRLLSVCHRKMLQSLLRHAISRSVRSTSQLIVGCTVYTRSSSRGC